MGKKKTDASTQKFLFGLIPTNRNAVSHVRGRSQPARDIKAARRKLAGLEKARDKLYPHSAAWKEYDKQIERFKRENDL